MGNRLVGKVSRRLRKRADLNHCTIQRRLTGLEGRVLPIHVIYKDAGSYGCDDLIQYYAHPCAYNIDTRYICCLLDELVSAELIYLC